MAYTSALFLAAACASSIAPAFTVAQPPAFSVVPVGRVFASTDPSASAALFQLAVKGAELVSQNISSDTECAEVVAVKLPKGVNSSANDIGQSLYFVRSKGAADLKPYSDHCASAFLQQNAGEIVYDPWGDNHDGYHSTEAFNIDSIVSQRKGLFTAENETGSWPLAALNVVVPNTTYNFQLWGHLGDETSLLPAFLPNWEMCRNESRGFMPPQEDLFWWKATYATPDPPAAAAFVEKLFGSQKVPSPFQDDAVPPSANCTEARWMLLQPFSNFMLHFVYSRCFSNPPALDPLLNLDDWTTNVLQGRLDAPDEVDGWMDNRVIFWVDDFTSFLARLDGYKIPYFLRSFASGQDISAIVTDPKTALAYEVRGKDATLARQAAPFECLRGDTL
ncbi:hypothetical protein M885DRAFT_527093 [Pelagophyceae sp. CCMP2097]|nr:hypothetical protein M885DRAFT_527093 [Pelagophyceae sp. CCMP2097]|mmetsp:Transcript_7185/g.25206  ORF Transcript_7185/g.25206 Transcript_7185/m.25206 type:complete len:391 (-) Transcript_7185:28-1200(-)